jgi:hypothetical protein
MLLDDSLASAFTPPPQVVLYEPAGRRGDIPVPAPRWQRVGTSNSQTVSELSLGIAREGGVAALASERPTAQDEQLKVIAAELSRRVQFLRIEAAIDSVPFSNASFADFQAFMSEMRPNVRPSLFLNDNGNLRALWKNDHREQVGLQFLGEGNIQFVIFKLRKEPLGMSRVAGVDAKDKVLAHIRASGAERLVVG